MFLLVNGLFRVNLIFFVCQVRGAILYSSGEYPASIADLSRVLVLNPDNAEALQQRSMAHVQVSPQIK